MRNANKRSIVITALVALIALSIFITTWPLDLRSNISRVWHMDILPQRGAETVDELTKSYLTSVQEENIDNIRQLVPRTHSVDTEDIKLMVMDMGGQTLKTEAVEVAVQNTEAVYMKWISFDGKFQDARGATVKFDTTLTAQKMGERWYLMIGKIK